MNPDIACFFDDNTNSASYVIYDPETSKGAIIDPVMGFNLVSGGVSYDNAKVIVDYVADKNLEIDWILETHVHADHLTASNWLKSKVGGRMGIGIGIRDVQKSCRAIFNLFDDLEDDGSQFDELFDSGSTFNIGNIAVTVLGTPGHTPACVTYVVGDACFVGDTLFMPDSGTARCDFPGGDAKQLYSSIQKIFQLPVNTRMFVAHDYGASGKRSFEWETTIGQQKKHNIHVGDGILEHDYVLMREQRDQTLDLPRLILPAMQVNIRGGVFPEAESNGISYLKLPVKALSEYDFS